jgi:site-specific DNA recombinase
MWTGGPQPLGYDLVAKKLVVNAAEAERVRATYALFLERASVMATVEELARRGWGTKAYTSQEGGQVASRPFTKDSLRRFLSDPLYAGRMRCGDDVVDGAHEAILEQATWDAAQGLLSQREPRRPGQRQSRGLLGGLVRCGVCGASMTYHYASRGGRRWTYVVCSTVQKRGASACPGSRVAAADLEAFVVERIRSMGRDPALVREVVAAAKRDLETRRPEVEAELARLETDRERLESERTNLVAAVAQRGPAHAPLVAKLAETDQALAAASGRAAEARAELARIDAGQIDEADLRASLAEMDQVWAELFPAERARVLALLIERVTFDGRTKDVEIAFRAGAGRVA